MEERRRYCRKDCKTQIFLTDREELFRCIAENISDGGVRIQVCDPIARKDQLTFFIDEETPFITRGKVAWNGGHSIGIEFERPAPDKAEGAGPSAGP